MKPIILKTTTALNTPLKLTKFKKKMDLLKHLPVIKGDLEAACDQELTEVQRQFRDNRKAEAATMTGELGDTRHWICICFDTNDRKEAFIAASGLATSHGAFADGAELASKMNIELPEVPRLSPKFIRNQMKSVPRIRTLESTPVESEPVESEPVAPLQAPTYQPRHTLPPLIEPKTLTASKTPTPSKKPWYCSDEDEAAPAPAPALKVAAKKPKKERQSAHEKLAELDAYKLDLLNARLEFLKQSNATVKWITSSKVVVDGVELVWSKRGQEWMESFLDDDENEAYL